MLDFLANMIVFSKYKARCRLNQENKVDDKKLTHKLVTLGLSWEHARIAFGVMCEQTDTAYQQGYNKGYNDGYENAKQKFSQDKSK